MRASEPVERSVWVHRICASVRAFVRTSKSDIVVEMWLRISEFWCELLLLDKDFQKNIRPGNIRQRASLPDLVVHGQLSSRTKNVRRLCTRCTLHCGVPLHFCCWASLTQPIKCVQRSALLPPPRETISKASICVLRNE